MLAITSSAQDTARHIRRGWTFGVLPSVAYDADLGLQYGALTNIYYFGDGSTYPDYLHSFYAEAAYTTVMASPDTLRHGFYFKDTVLTPVKESVKYGSPLSSVHLKNDVHLLSTSFQFIVTLKFSYISLPQLFLSGMITCKSTAIDKSSGLQYTLSPLPYEAPI